mmetsp:Transcript_8138/g.20250  ORF Transcript_8138/g.20250 Transcript_8138/m.20250 type:complete len:478 (+) Transcript_8138:194-1627(+)
MVALDDGEDLLGHRDGVVDVLLGVGQAHEARLVLRGREVHAALEHRAVPARELLRVARGGVLEALDRALAEEEAEHARDAAAAHGVARLLARGEDALDQPRGHLVELLVLARLREDLHRLDARTHGEGIAAERARLVHGARRRDVLHDLLLARVGAHRQAAADDLAKGGEVGLDAPVLLRAAVRDAEARHHLVEDEERALLLGELTQALEELLVGDDEARVAHHRLEDHAGHLALVGLEERLDALEVVVLGDERAVRRALGHAGRVGQAEGDDTAARRDEEGVGVAVVAPLELDHLLALGVRTHEAQHAHARLRARVGEAHHLDGRHRVDDHLGELVLERTRRAERGALLHGLGDGGEHAVVGVADDGRAPRAHVVHVLVAVDVVRLAALDVVEHDGVAADRLEGADGRGDAARHDLDRLGHDRVRLGGHVLHLGGLHDRRATAHRGAAGHVAASKEAQSKRGSVDHDGDTEHVGSA